MIDPSRSSSTLIASLLVVAGTSAAQERRWPRLERYEAMVVPADNPLDRASLQPAKLSRDEKRQILEFLRELEVDFVDAPPRLPEENMEVMTLQITRISQIALVVHDIAKAEEFYKDTLGLKHLFSVPGKLAFFDVAGTRIMLGLPEPQVSHKSAIVYFDVDDIQAAHEELRAKNTPSLGTPHVVGKLGDKEVWVAEFQDPDGNLLALQSVQPAK